MRWSLRATLLGIVLPLSLLTLVMSAARMADLVAVRDDIAALRVSAFRSIYIERYGHELEVLLEEAFEALSDGHGRPESVASARADAMGTLEHLRPLVSEAPVDGSSMAGLTAVKLREWEQTQTEIDRHLARAFALADRGQKAQARHLVMDELDVLVHARILSSIDPIMQREQEMLEGHRVRTMRATEHWLAGWFGAIDLRERLLPDVYEAILAERFARNVHADFRGFMLHVLEDRPLDPSHRLAASVAATQLGKVQRTRADRSDAHGGAEAGESPETYEHRHGELYQEVLDTYSRALTLPPESRADVRSAIVQQIDEVLEQSLMPQMDAFVREREVAIEQEIARLDRFSGFLMMLVVAIAIVAMLVGFGSPLLASRFVLAPIDDLVETLRRFREGQRDARPRYQSSSELGVLARLLKRVLEEQQATARTVRALVFYDSATGLPNRQFFQERLVGALVTARAQSRSMGLLAINLAGLKQINVTLGHKAGDDLIRQVATRLRDCVRTSDIVARPGDDAADSELSRVGGDEFTILLTNISRAPDATIAAQRVLLQLGEPFDVEGREITIHTSIGIGIFPQDGVDGETLLRNASAAMNSAIGRGGNCYQFHSEALNIANSRKLQIQSRLNGAIERGDLTLHYQPLRDAADGGLTGAEALLRWTDSEMGPIGPDEFIPIAEHAGLISRIGGWVLAEACKQGRAWQDEGRAPIRMSVNVSACQLRDTDWVRSVGATLRETGFSPGCLEIEITETAIIHDDRTTLNALTQISEMGVGIVLDDFGTGYSSLSHLRHLPIYRLKIDRFFVSEISDDGQGGALPTAIITLAHSLGLAVVAEGVETQEQANFLRSNGCDELQGYLISRPLPASEFERFMDRQKPE